MALVSPNPLSSNVYGKSSSSKSTLPQNGNSSKVANGAGRRSVSGDARIARINSSASARVPAPTLNGNRNSITPTPPYLESRKRVSSTPSISTHGNVPRSSSISPTHSRSGSQNFNPTPFHSVSPSGHPHFQHSQFPQQNQFAYAQQYPFVPSPHPNAYANNSYSSFPTHESTQQHQAMLIQQAQFQQQQWQAEMMRNSAMAAQQKQSLQNGAQRVRATSGPSPSPYPRPRSTSSAAYPPSPSYPPVLLPVMSNVPSLPPGAMLPQFGNAYPTPPASAEGRADSCHPYKRAKEVIGTGGGGSKNGNGNAKGSGSSDSSNSNSSSAVSSQGRTVSTSSGTSTEVVNSKEKFNSIPSAPVSIYDETLEVSSTSSIQSGPSTIPTTAQNSRDSSITSLPDRGRSPSVDSTTSTNRVVSGGIKKSSPLSQDNSALASTSGAIVNSNVEEEDSDDTTLPSSAVLVREKKGFKQKLKKTFSIQSNLDSAVSTGVAKVAAVDGESVRNPPPSSSKRFGILNSKLNSSTDNISISSTVSTASMMMKKLGQFGKLARRNSLMSLTKAFKSSSKDDEVSANKLSKDKKKGSLAGTSVAHVTVELESESGSPGMSPAATLAKKHQQLYAEQEAKADSNLPRFDVHARSTSIASIQSNTLSGKNLKGKGKKWGFGTNKEEENTFVAEPSSYGGDSSPIIHTPMSKDGLPFDNSMEQLSGGFDGEDEFENGYGIPPDPKRDARPSKSILKGAGTYNQADFEFNRPSFPRTRANSAENFSQNRPLSPNHSFGEGSNQRETLFEDQIDRITASTSSTYLPNSGRHSPLPSPYSNPNQNYSAPVLHLSSSRNSSRPTSTYSRSASSTKMTQKKLSFALNLSVHTTWPATVYDRRAEPAACNRLTPAFAQRIKEELNAFKMEEMEVHPGSRNLTHFFV